MKDGNMLKKVRRRNKNGFDDLHKTIKEQNNSHPNTMIGTLLYGKTLRLFINL